MNTQNTMTAEQAQQIEQTHNVCVDIDTMQYNNDSHDSTYGWYMIPQAWIDEI